MYSIYQYFGYQMPLRERFAMIKTAGFDAVGLMRDDWYGWSGHREFADLARTEGLQVADGHAPCEREYGVVNALWLDNLDGLTTYEIYLRAVNDAAEDGISNLIIHLDERVAPPPNELGLSRLNRLVRAAEERGVTIALENIWSYRYLTYVFERLISPNLGFCYDVGHQHCAEPNTDLLSMFGDKLVALHLYDNDGTASQHLLPFEGNIDWEEQMSKIVATGYDGAITLECFASSPKAKNTDYTRSAEEWLRDAFTAAERLRSLLGYTNVSALK